jgi:hypothetical protein
MQRSFAGRSDYREIQVVSVFISSRTLCVGQMSDQQAMDLFVAWATKETRLVCTERMANHKCLLKPYKLYVPFMLATRDWWKENHGYTFAEKPGQVGDFFRLFRDKIMLPGLRRARAQRLGVAVEQVDETRMQMKTESERRKNLSGDGEIPVRAILGWHWCESPAIVSSVAMALDEADLFLPVDNERILSFDMDETSDVYPDYTALIITAGTGTIGTNDAENAPKKRPRGRAPKDMEWDVSRGEWVAKRAPKCTAAMGAKRLRVM